MANPSGLLHVRFELGIIIVKTTSRGPRQNTGKFKLVVARFELILHFDITLDIKYT